MDEQDKQRFVQQYVQRQKAYLPTYTAEHLFDVTPKPSRSDAFGFATPVLRPRVPLTLQPGPKKASRDTEEGLGPSPRETSPEPRDKKEKARAKRGKTSTPIDTDNERAARLADRRERKRKKRDIVTPPEKQDDAIASKKGRAHSQKQKKPGPLALLYGFSATNVTEGRLTLKPAPSLGVFSKGKASVKKTVTATRKSTRNDLFSETAFLNKSSKRAAGHSRTDSDSDDNSISTIPKELRSSHTKKGRDGHVNKPTLETPPQVPIRTTGNSETWDIELQSNLPSSAHDVISEIGEKESGPVVLDIRADVAQEREVLHNMTQNRTVSSPPRQQFVVRSSPDQCEESHIALAVDTPSIHPSHSASQVGRRIADPQASDLRLVESKYFAKPKPISTQEFATNPLQSSRSKDESGTPLYFGKTSTQVSVQELVRATEPRQLNDDPEPPELGSVSADSNPLQSMGPNGDIDAAMDLRTIGRMASPIDSVTNVPQPMAIFQAQYDMVTTLNFPSDDYEWEPLGILEGDVDHTQDEYRRDDVSYDVNLGDDYDPLAPQYECQAVGEWEGFDVYDEAVSGSIHYSEGVGGSAADFFEGELEEKPVWVGMSGLAQAEMEVASRLRDHWRPLRL